MKLLVLIMEGFLDSNAFNEGDITWWTIVGVPPPNI
jgi:hypothetical protein